jgi:hypothetical protein
MEDPRTEEMLDSALAYRARGWSVIPVQARAKRPLVAWRVYQHRIASEDEIQGWFRRWPDANVAVVTGQVSGIVVVDVDPRHGGTDSVAAAEAESGLLQATVEATTGGGGRHLYYAHPGPAMTNRVGMLPGVDLRGDGGCAVAPPSVHPNGRRYTWVAGRGPGEVALAPLPPHFGGAGAAPRGLGPSRGHSPRRVRGDIGEGACNDTLVSLSGDLLRRGVCADVVCELMLAWNRKHCRPPLADAEVVRVVDRLAPLHARQPGAAG